MFYLSWPAAGGAADQSRLEQVYNELLQPQQPTLEQMFANTLQSTDEAVKTHSVIKGDVDHVPLTFNYCEVWQWSTLLLTWSSLLYR